jgi:hypothetical protein
MAFSFRDLNLSGVNPETSTPYLKPGRYVCDIINASLKDVRNGGKQVEVEYKDVVTGGVTKDYITVLNAGSKDAQEIGRRRLKAILTYGHHPNPDNPGDINSLKGLRIGVNVDEGEDYTNDAGETKKGANKPRKYGAYFDAAELGGTQTPAPAAAPAARPAPNDDIPF